MLPEISFGSITIPTFFIVISFSLSLLTLYLSRRVDLFSKNRQQAFDLALILMTAGFVGGRLFHIFYEEWPFYKKYPWQMFYFWQGGFVFFGGFITAVAVTWIYCRWRKISFLNWADFFAPLLSLGHAFGRIGCFLSGCCYGQYCDLPFSINGRHPTTLYLFIGEVFIYFYLLFYERKIIRLQDKENSNLSELKEINKESFYTGAVFMKWLLLHSLLRFYTEYFRDDFRGIFINVGPLGHWSVSQLICFILILTALLYFISKSAVCLRFCSRQKTDHLADSHKIPNLR